MGPGRVGGPDELVAGAPDGQPGRRRLGWAAGLVASGVLLAVVRPDLSLHGERRADPQPSPAPTETVSFAPPLDGIRWPPRGDLVDDENFVRAAMSRVRGERADATRLFFAGWLPDGSRLALAGTDVNRGVVASSVHALLVPPGVPVAAADVEEAPALTDPRQVLAWAVKARAGDVSLVVLSRPLPVRFEVSGRVTFRPDGSPEREWTAVRPETGAAVVDLGRRLDPVVAVRARGRGVFPLPVLVPVVPRVPRTRFLAVSGAAEEGYRGPDARTLSRGLRGQAGALLDLDASRREVIWSGSPWKQRRLALVLVTRADGRRFQALVGEQGDRGFPAGVRALPRRASDRLPWLLEPFSAEEPTLLLCPTGTGSLVYARAGRAPRVLPVDDRGVAALVPPGPSPPSASGAEVVLLDPQGAEILTTTLPRPGFDDPFALD